MRRKIFVSFVLFLYLFCGEVTTNAQIPKADSLVKIAKTSKIDTICINAYIDAMTYLMEKHPEKAIQYGKTALQISKKINHKTKEGFCLKNIGVGFDYKGDLDSCLYYLNKSVDVFSAENDDEKIAFVLEDMGIAYYYRSNYEMALKNYLKALELLKKTNSKHLSKMLNNIGLLYKARKDYDNAIRYFRESITLKEKNENESGLVNTYLNVGSLYKTKTQYDSAYFYNEKCYLLAKKLQLTDDMAAALTNMGEAQFVMKKYSQAEQNFDNAYHLINNENSYSNVSWPNLLNGLSKISIHKKQYSKAINQLEEALLFSKKNNNNQQVNGIYESLSDCYRASGNYEKALIYKDSVMQLSNEMLNEENIRHMNELSVVYESNEKEKEILKLNLENKNAASEVAQRKSERNYSIIASLIFIILAAFLYVAYISNKKKKEQLNTQKIIIESALKDKEILLKEIHHRVKNNLQLISSLLSLQSDYIKDEFALDAVKESRNRVQSMALIHQNLYQEDNLTGIAVADYIQKLCENLFYSYNIKPTQIKLIKEVENINLDVDMVVPLGLIINELITNSLKYAFVNHTEGLIKLMIKIENSQLLLAVYDNGLGFSENPVNETPSTFGFKMIQTFVNKMKGTLKVYNEDGARVEITLNLLNIS